MPRRPASPDSASRFLIQRRFTRDPEFAGKTRAFGPAAEESPDLVDYLFLNAADPHPPEDVFPRLRWGGQVILAGPDPALVAAAARQFPAWRRHESGGESAWSIEQPPAMARKFPLNLRLLPFPRRIHYFVARKTALIPPGLSSDRFTYHVYLGRNPESARIDGPRGTAAWEVVKEIPTTARVLARLREKFPDADADTLNRRARKFTDKIFPVFLTRENAILKLLQRDLPKHFQSRVPQVLSFEQDSRGYTRTLRLNWLRNGRGGMKPLTQLEFARQSAELLAALHDDAHIMHLDLRLDNFVITPDGVGFVDFGSAVRVGEAFPDASLLSNLFGEMMRTSQIQRMLGKMSDAGQVTSEEIKGSYQRVDKAVDFFYLAVQINNPHANPDFKGLVDFDKNSPEAREISALTAEILRPADPKNAPFKSARQILEGIQSIETRLHHNR